MNLAYLDPASGGMLATALVAGFAGAAVTVKVWWRRIWGKVRRRPVDTTTGPAAMPDRLASSPEQEG